MSARVMYDLEKPLAAYFKADTAVAGVFGGAGGVRVYSDGIPRKSWDDLVPYAHLFMVGGGEPVLVTTPESAPWIQVESWAKTKTAARAGIIALANAAGKVQRPTPLPDVSGQPRCTLLGIWRMNGPIWMPDTQPDRPRFLMTLVCTAVWG